MARPKSGKTAGKKTPRTDKQPDGLEKEPLAVSEAPVTPSAGITNGPELPGPAPVAPAPAPPAPPDTTIRPGSLTENPVEVPSAAALMSVLATEKPDTLAPETFSDIETACRKLLSSALGVRTYKGGALYANMSHHSRSMIRTTIIVLSQVLGVEVAGFPATIQDALQLPDKVVDSLGIKTTKQTTNFAAA